CGGLMSDFKQIILPALFFLIPLGAQEPAVGGAAGGNANAAAIAGSKEDPAAVERGSKLFAGNCGGCHGMTARGGAGAPDLVRSLVVLDDEKGILIAPVIRNGRPDQGMPKSSLSDAQIADIVAWLHADLRGGPSHHIRLSRRGDRRCEEGRSILQDDV